MEDDFLKRYQEHGMEELPVSPMDPPDARYPPAVEEVAYEDLAPVLKELWDEHEEYTKVLSAFEQAFIEMKKNEWKMNPDISSALKNFFQFTDETITLHHRKEEKALFPPLREKYIEHGEHSPGERPLTPVDMMEGEHDKTGQSVAIVFTLLGLAPRIRDDHDRFTLFDTAFNVAHDIVDTMKLHIYRENTIIFPVAQSLLSEADLKKAYEVMKSC